MATVWKSNGETYAIEPANGTSFSLKEMQAVVGGYIELVHLDQDSIMIVSEDGLLKELPLNEMGTRLYDDMARRNGWPGGGQSIVGDILVCSRKQAGYEEL